MKKSELKQIIQEELENITEAKASADDVLDDINRALSKIKGMNGKPIRFEMDSEYPLQVLNPNSPMAVDVKIYF